MKDLEINTNYNEINNLDIISRYNKYLENKNSELIIGNGSKIDITLDFNIHWNLHNEYVGSNNWSRYMDCIISNQIKKIKIKYYDENILIGKTKIEDDFGDKINYNWIINTKNIKAIKINNDNLVLKKNIKNINYINKNLIDNYNKINKNKNLINRKINIYLLNSYYECEVDSKIEHNDETNFNLSNTMISYHDDNIVILNKNKSKKEKIVKTEDIIAISFKE